MTKKSFHGGYHHEQWHYGRNKNITLLIKKLEKTLTLLELQNKDVCLIGMGMSGAMSVPEISSRTKIPFALIRQAKTKTALCGADSEPLIGVTRSKAIFIDDLIDTGYTIKRVRKILQSNAIDLVGGVMMQHLPLTRSGEFYFSQRIKIPILAVRK